MIAVKPTQLASPLQPSLEEEEEEQEQEGKRDKSLTCFGATCATWVGDGVWLRDQGAQCTTFLPWCLGFYVRNLSKRTHLNSTKNVFMHQALGHINHGPILPESMWW